MAINWSPLSAATPADAETEPLDPALIKLAVILLVGVVMVAFDTTIVATSKKEISPRPKEMLWRKIP
jgi:hypothetical protein